MREFVNQYLVAAAFATFVAALMHYACIIWGAPLFRLLGAGDAVVAMLNRGHTQPLLMAAIVGTALLLCSAYALSAAGLILVLPLRRVVLLGLIAVLVVRGLAFPWLKPFFVGNSDVFWWTSSAICLMLAAVHAIGLRQVWSELS
nr:hypothetical protein [uncultured Undibacterium sp.]